MKNSWHIVSYPRSGNHLIRGLLEAYSQRPTLGCPNSSLDGPIHERFPNKTKKIIEISDETPIGYKAHNVREIQLNNQLCSLELNLILITRNPKEAISSHLARLSSSSNPIKKFVRNRTHMIRKNVEKELETYMDLVTFFHNFDGVKIHLEFEKLVDNAWQQRNLLPLMAEITGCIPDPAIIYKDVLSISKDSQSSLPKNLYHRKQKISSILEQYIDYELVKKHLN